MTDRTDSTTCLTGQEAVRFGCIVVALTLLVTAPVAATAGTTQSTNQTTSLPAEPAFIVDLETNGSANVTLVATFDLTTDSEREAFKALRANETAREQRTDRFAARMEAIATQAQNATGRDMAIRNPAMTFMTENDTGIIALSVRWDGLTTQKGDQLVLREPFASGFDIDRPFRVIAPDGYELVTATPNPTTQQQNNVTWSAHMQFDDFKMTFAPTKGGTATHTSTTTSEAGGPGFGISVTAVALLATTVLLTIRHRRK